MTKKTIKVTPNIDKEIAKIAKTINETSTPEKIEEKPETNLKNEIDKHQSWLENLNKSLNWINGLLIGGFLVLAITVAGFLITIISNYREDIKQLHDDRYQLLQERIDNIDQKYSKLSVPITTTTTIPEQKK